MKRFFAVAVIFGAVVAGMVYLLSPDLEKAVSFFADKIRASLFTGLLTVGSFLLSLKVFIVVKFKETVFDTKEYRERLEDLRKVDPSPPGPHHPTARCPLWSMPACWRGT